VASPSIQHRIDSVRRFNRFYTRRIGALNEHLLQSDFSLGEVRVLYEIAHQSAPTAAAIASQLSVDRGYLSRLLASLRKRGIVRGTTSARDARESILSLTPKGARIFGGLDRAADAEVGAMLRELSVPGQARLLEAMGAIGQLLGEARATAPAFTLRKHRAGDGGWVVQRHGELYAREYGWNLAFEALVAEIVADFLRDFDPECERCWITEQNGVRIGCVFLVRRSKTVAQLRLLLVEPDARGMGVGQRLVQECIAFSRQAGYRKIMLWTNDVLVSARRIYESEGFRLVEEERHDTFGKPLTSQTWELLLRSTDRGRRRSTRGSA